MEAVSAGEQAAKRGTMSLASLWPSTQHLEIEFISKVIIPIIIYNVVSIINKLQLVNELMPGELHPRNKLQIVNKQFIQSKS